MRGDKGESDEGAGRWLYGPLVTCCEPSGLVGLTGGQPWGRGCVAKPPVWCELESAEGAKIGGCSRHRPLKPQTVCYTVWQPLPLLGAEPDD